jgi:hypothetical protein
MYCVWIYSTCDNLHYYFWNMLFIYFSMWKFEMRFNIELYEELVLTYVNYGLWISQTWKMLAFSLISEKNWIDFSLCILYVNLKMTNQI